MGTFKSFEKLGAKDSPTLNRGEDSKHDSILPKNYLIIFQKTIKPFFKKPARTYRFFLPPAGDQIAHSKYLTLYNLNLAKRMNPESSQSFLENNT